MQKGRRRSDLVDELAAEHCKVEDLRTVLSAIVAADAGLASAKAHRRSALEAATSPPATE